MGIAFDGDRYIVLYGRSESYLAFYDQRLLLCVRFDLRADLVSVPFDHEEPLLYNLSYF